MSLKHEKHMRSEKADKTYLEWRRNSKVPPEEFIKLVIPSIMYGIDFETKNNRYIS